MPYTARHLDITFPYLDTTTKPVAALVVEANRRHAAIDAVTRTLTGHGATVRWYRTVDGARVAFPAWADIADVVDAAEMAGRLLTPCTVTVSPVRVGA